MTGTRYLPNDQMDQMRDEKNGIAIRSVSPVNWRRKRKKKKRESHTRIILIAKNQDYFHPISFICYHHRHRRLVP